MYFDPAGDFPFQSGGEAARWPDSREQASHSGEVSPTQRISGRPLHTDTMDPVSEEKCRTDSDH